MLELRVQYLDDNATDGSGELSTPAGELIGRSPIHVYVLYFNSVADPGCLSRIPDPTFFHPRSWIHIKKFNFFTFFPQKIVSLSKI
jgi:hypothetical protein